jgi:hypothetical protein
MSKDAPKPLSELFSSPNSGLGQLAGAARRRAELSDFLRSNIDPALAGALVHCNLRDDGTLIVTALNPEWAARLRFESAQLKMLAERFGAEVTGVAVRVSH